MTPKHSTGKKIAEGLGLAAVSAAAAAAGLYLYGKDGKKHRQKLKLLAGKAQKEVLKQAAQAGKLSEGAYKKILTEVLKKYRQAKTIKPEELAALAGELKNQWGQLAKKAGKLGSSPAKKAKPARKK